MIAQINKFRFTEGFSPTGKIKAALFFQCCQLKLCHHVQQVVAQSLSAMLKCMVYKPVKELGISQVRRILPWTHDYYCGIYIG